MLNEKLLKLEKNYALINYLDNSEKIKGWHCVLLEGDESVHILGAKTPILALNKANELLQEKRFGEYKVNENGDIEVCEYIYI